MSDVSSWRLFAYMDDDESGERDESRRLAEWQIQDALRWAVTRGFDNIYLSRDSTKTARWSRGIPVPVRQHMHLVEGSSRGQGDDAA